MLVGLHKLSTDDRARHRIIMIVGAGTALAGGLSQYAGTSIPTAAAQAMAVGVILYAILVCVYCLSEKTRRTQVASRRDTATVLICLLVVVGSALVPSEKVEGAILENHMRKLISSPRLSNNQAKDLTDSLNVADNRITLKQAIRARVLEAIKGSDPTPEVAAAADALVKYRPPAVAPPKPTPAQAVCADAEEEFLAALNLDIRNNAPISLEKSQLALDALSHCIDLAAGDQSAQAPALLARGVIYNSMGKFSEALADGEKADGLGATQLDSIVSVEVHALIGLGGERNLNRAIKLATLGIEMKEPKAITERWAHMDDLSHLVLLYYRARAYYSLGEFDAAIADCDRALMLIPPSGYLQEEISKARAASVGAKARR
jgi:tetratricopeptide (TPR) repeat protein